MARWEPDAPGRLSEAAMELFERDGYDATTVDDIAAAAGVTKRTFFRHYADKREVLFGEGDSFRRAFLDALAEVAPDTGALDAAAAATLDVAASFDGRHAHSSRRQRVIVANAALRERELVKLAGIAADLAAGLRERGVSDPVATMAGESAMVAFRAAFERWAAGPADPDLPTLLREAFAALRTAVA